MMRHYNWKIRKQVEEALRECQLDPRRKGGIPREGTGVRQASNGLLVRAEPVRPGHFRIRVQAQCPSCSEWLPAGRLHQHTGSKRCEAIRLFSVGQLSQAHPR